MVVQYFLFIGLDENYRNVEWAAIQTAKCKCKL